MNRADGLASGETHGGGKRSLAWRPLSVQHTESVCNTCLSTKHPYTPVRMVPQMCPFVQVERVGILCTTDTS